MFEEAYERLYSLRLPEVDVEIVSWRLVATGPVASRDSVPALPVDAGQAAQQTQRALRRQGCRGAGLCARDLACDQIVDGPAIIEERETTIIMLPGWRAKVDRTGCIMASKE